MDLEHTAIKRIQLASELSLKHYEKPLVCTYSGGKDSDVMLVLFIRAGVPFEVVNNHTTVDAPQTVRHTREVFRTLEDSGIKATISYPEMSMWQLIPYKKYPPTRIQRYCCEYFKETKIKNRFIATGVRWDESRSRRDRIDIEPVIKNKKERQKFMLMNDNDQKRLMMERCTNKADMIVNPIIDWKDSDIWEFYWNECEFHNPLYKMGYTRVGCIGCPMAGVHRYKEFADFPKYKDAYIRAFGRMLEEIYKSGKPTKWRNAEDVFKWWMEDDNLDGQMELSDFIEY